MSEKTLDEVYAGEELELALALARRDLVGVVNEVVSWLEGGEVDPDMLGYISSFLSSMTYDFPQNLDD